jgi:hypothetical protein
LSIFLPRALNRIRNNYAFCAAFLQSMLPGTQQGAGRAAKAAGTRAN